MVNEAITAFNRGEIADLISDTGLRWIGLDQGKVYALGEGERHIRVLAPFQSPDGRWWADAALAIESLDEGDVVTEYWHQNIAGGGGDCHDLWIYSDMRGRWNALIAPVDQLAAQLDLQQVTELPPGNWARNWWTDPERNDAQELAWIANGGHPLHAYRGIQL